jgi:hypothetical protein
MNQNDSLSNLSNVVDFLTSLGYNDFIFIVYQFVLPSASLIGLLLCSSSLWIFFTNIEFKPKLYDYYRFLVIIYWIHLALAIPYALFFTPRYFQTINTYPWTCYQIFHYAFSNFLCHVEGVIEIGILMDRNAIFTPFVKKNYKLEPKLNCLIFTFICLIINIECAFVCKPFLAGSFFYVDSRTGQKIENSLYYPVLTDFGQSQIGFAFTIIICFFRDFLTLVVGLVLNIKSGIHLRNYYASKSRVMMGIEVAPNTSNKTNVSTTKHSKNKAKLMPMIVTLCCISIVERLILLSSSIYFFFALDESTMTLGTILDLVLISGPTLSFFVFYFFNNHFNKAFLSFFK